jgi:hypothetical protein
LPKRVFDIDIERCQACVDRLKFIAAIERILAQLGLSAQLLLRRQA